MNTTKVDSNSGLLLAMERAQLFIFFVVTFVISATVAAIASAAGDENFAILIVLSPTLVAIVLTGLLYGRSGLRALLVEQSLHRISIQWLVVALLGIPVIAMVAIYLHSLFGGPALQLRTTQLLPQIIIILIIAVGEEYGWRGYALPLLQKKYSALVASIILGLVWGFWHFPAYLIGTGVPLDMSFCLFMLWVLPATILITWVYNNTGSVLTAILMHGAANASFNYLLLLPEFVGQTTTFWLFVGLLWLVTIAVVILFKPSRLVRRSAV